MRVAVIGLGLIGGSIALAAREYAGAEVTGWDVDPLAVQAAIGLGAISAGAGPLASAVARADAVFLAAPVGALPRLIGEVLAAAPATAVVTDTGSTKRTTVEAIRDPRFVGGHPLAGAETSGIEHARADLFADSTWYLTPGAGTAAQTTARVAELIVSLGAQVTELAPDAHDRLMAAMSHLPHVLANVLVAHLMAIGVPAVLGPSFRDATRVAGSNPTVWSSIYLDNREELVTAIDHTIELLAEFRGKLDAGADAAVRQWCDQAAADRARLER